MKTRLCKTILISASLLLAAPALAAPLPPAYSMALARVQQQLSQISDTAHACSALHPPQAGQQAAALAAWRVRQALLLQEYERRYQGWLQVQAGGDRLLLNRYQRIMRDKFGQQRVVREAQLRADGPARSRRLCQDFARRLHSHADDSWQQVSADMQQLRRLRPVY